MKLTPRPYQQEAHDAVIDWWRQSTAPCVIEAATGAGKSVVVAMLAETLHKLSNGKRVLCLQPSKELTEQNSEKFEQTGLPYSIYSASISKSLRHQVIFATALSFRRVAKRLGSEFAGVIIDEAHGITPTIKNIISDMQEGNPNLRVCGLTATPYRLDDGYIYAHDLDGQPVPEAQAKDPYFARLVYQIGAHYLIEQGFLTPPVVGAINATSYDTSNIRIQANGQFNKQDINTAFVGWGRKTAHIVADVVAQSVDKMGVMFFAATIAHATEIMASLPPDYSALITGKTPKAERQQIISRFKNRRIKYLCNVSVLTTGFDAEHVDVVAILRATESVGLLQQIIGRGLRLHPDKKECLVLDYAENLDRHCPDGDIFNPKIKASFSSNEPGELVQARCESCNAINQFNPRPNPDHYKIDDYGYFTDLSGVRLDMPAHYGRRCTALTKESRYTERCDYWWTYKECPQCEHRNDIAARYCESCKNELIDPNEKLIANYKALKRNPRVTQTDEIVHMDLVHGLSRRGDKMLTVTIQTTHRKFSCYFLPEHQSNYVRSKALNFMRAYQSEPKTVTYRKNDDFWEILEFNRRTDKELLNASLGTHAPSVIN